MKYHVDFLINKYWKDLITTRTWIHIDMDMFFAAVEIRDDPSLGDIPIVVGDNSMI